MSRTSTNMLQPSSSTWWEWKAKVWRSSAMRVRQMRPTGTRSRATGRAVNRSTEPSAGVSPAWSSSCQGSSASRRTTCTGWGKPSQRKQLRSISWRSTSWRQTR